MENKKDKTKVWQENTKEDDDKFLLWLHNEGSIQKIRDIINENHREALREYKDKVEHKHQVSMQCAREAATETERERIWEVIEKWQHSRWYGNLNHQVSDEMLNELKSAVFIGKEKSNG